MRKFFIGLLVGILISTASITFAASTEVIAKFTTFNFNVNGEEKSIDKEPVVIEGSSYLPVRAIGEMLGYDVLYHGSTRTIEFKSNEEKETNNNIPVSEIGVSRANPADIGIKVVHEFKDLLYGTGKANITIDQLIRGEEAWSRIEEANMFNEPAEEGYEYILAHVNFELIEGNSTKQYDLAGYNFDLVSSTGKDYEKLGIVLPKPAIDAKLYEGASNEGWVAFKVSKTDEKPLIVFGKDYDGTGGAWFKGYY